MLVSVAVLLIRCHELAYSHLRDIDLRCSSDRGVSLALGFEAARHAVSLDSASCAAHLVLGQAYVWAERYDAAIEGTETAVDLNPNNAHACMALAALFRSGQ